MIQPYLPTFNSDDITALQIKKTSWKNVRKFIKALDKEQLLKSKERSGGETVILDIDFDDQQVNDFQPYRLPKKTSTGASQQETSAAPTTNADDSIDQKIQIVHLLKPHKSLQPVFSSTPADLQALYLPTELRQHLTTYIEREELIVPTDKSRVKIDPILADALYATATTSTNDYEAQQAMVQGHVGRDALFTRAQTHACTAYHLIKRTPAGAPKPDPAAATARLDRKAAAQGPPPRVKITLETRSGNKTATRVSGLEPFGVAAGPLGEALQKACASSTSVAPLVGSSPKKPVMEVMVQGPQRDAVLRQLEKRGISKAWVDVADKTKKKGGR
jgi:translation initiation factor 2D